MKRIAEELKRVLSIVDVVHADFFMLHEHRTDMEWWMLGHAMECLHAAEFAEKWPTPDEGDFQVYDGDGKALRMVEVTEALLPGRKRTLEYRQARLDPNLAGAPGHLVEKESKAWDSLHEILKKKCEKSYPEETWLVVFFDILNSKLPGLPNRSEWEKKILDMTATWDLPMFRFGGVFVMDHNATAMVELSPDRRVIRPAK